MNIILLLPFLFINCFIRHTDAGQEVKACIKQEQVVEEVNFFTPLIFLNK